MTEALVLALGVPTALVGAWLLWRRSWSQAFADIRGIALQTVIVIVVMLVIAGGVAGVLLSRGGEAIGTLEAQSIDFDVSGVTVNTCTLTRLIDSEGSSISGVNTGGPPFTSCVWTASSAAATWACSGGTNNVIGGADTCTVTY